MLRQSICEYKDIIPSWSTSGRIFQLGGVLFIDLVKYSFGLWLDFSFGIIKFCVTGFVVSVIFALVIFSK